MPSVHLSRAASRLAVAACTAEMSDRRAIRQLGWDDDSLSVHISRLGRSLPNLLPAELCPIADRLPRLREQAETLATLSDADLARQASRTFEMGLSSLWIFTAQGANVTKLWDPWKAKLQGCFFTPQFVAEVLAARGVDAATRAVLDPAVGGGDLLIEAYVALEPHLGPSAIQAMYGVDSNPELIDLAGLGLEFLAGRWSGGRPRVIGEQLRCGNSLLAPSDGPDSWTEWFPNPMSAGGFDAVLMNPPYGQLKVNASSLPARVSDDKRTEAARAKALDLAKARAATTAAALKAHPDYAFARGGVPDLPRFFIERALGLLCEGGRLACIVPSTFLADHRSQSLRRHLLESHRLDEVDLIPEDARLFLGVNQPTCVMVAVRGDRTERIAVRRAVVEPRDFRSRPVMVSKRLIETVDPDELRLPVCGRSEIALLRALHRHTRLGDLPWVHNLRGELDLTLDREYISRGSTGLPLIRGDQVDRYRSGLATKKESWVEPEFLARLSAAKSAHQGRVRLVSRQCAYLKRPRRLGFVPVEGGHVVGNSCNYIALDPDAAPFDEADALMLLLGILNSGWLEWRFNLTSSTNHVGNYELAALPIPVPDDASLASEIAAGARGLLREPDDEQLSAAVDGLVAEAFGVSGVPPS